MQTVRVQPDNLYVGPGMKPIAIVHAQVTSFYFMFAAIPGGVDLDRVVNRMLLATAKAMGADKVVNIRVDITPSSGIWVVRRKFTNHFDRLSYFDPVWRFLTRRLLRRRLNRMIHAAGKVDTFLLSDENLLGLISANYWRGSLYPWARRRASILKSLFGEREAHFFLCIRRYPDYLTSSWLQMASKGRPPAFEKYLEKFPPEGRGWAEVAADICGAVGAGNVTVWTYDWFSEDPSRVFRLLAPGTDFALPEKELKREILPSLTIILDEPTQGGPTFL